MPKAIAWTLADGDVQVTPNGGSAVDAEVRGRFFVARNVPLQDGTNSIEADTDADTLADNSPSSDTVTDVALDTSLNVSYTYNANGDLVLRSEEGGSVQWSYCYSTDGWLTKATKIVDSETVFTEQYWYDPIGRKYKVSTTENQQATTRCFVYDRGSIILQLDEGGELSREFVRGLSLGGGIGGLLYVRDSSGAVGYSHYDGRGNVVSVTDESRTEVAYYEYDAWGNLLTACGEHANEFGFSTKQASLDTGLIDYGYRWYDPRTARWIQRDPLGASGGLNQYSFVANNPSMFVDRWGLKTGYRLIVLEIVVDDGFVHGNDVDWGKIKRELGSAGRCEVRTDFVEKHEEKDLKHVREDGELFYRIQVHLTDKVKTHVGGGGGGEATVHGGKHGELDDVIDKLEKEGYNRRHILVCAILHEIGHALDLHHQSDKAVEKYGDSVMHTEGGDMIVPRSENASFNELDCTLIQRTLKQAGHKLTRLSIKLTRLLHGLYGLP